jgi:hypothetical protein
MALAGRGSRVEDQHSLIRHPSESMPLRRQGLGSMRASGLVIHHG